MPVARYSPAIAAWLQRLVSPCCDADKAGDPDQSANKSQFDLTPKQ